MRIQKHGLYRVGERGHVVVIVSIEETRATYRVVQTGPRVSESAVGREKTVGWRNLERLIDSGDGGAVHLCPRCVPDAAVERTLWALLTHPEGLSGAADCPLCGGTATARLTPVSVRMGACTFTLRETDPRAGTATVVDQDGNRYLPAWVPGSSWTARDWARLVDMAEHGVAAPASPASGLIEARLEAIRETVAAVKNTPLAAVPVLARIGAIASGELDAELPALVRAAS